MRFFLNHWQGKLPLSQAFWINLIAISALGCYVEYQIHDYFLFDGSGFITVALCYFILFHILIFIWQVVGVLRACDNNIKNYIASGWTRSAQFFVLTGFAATLIWGITLGQQLWKITADTEQTAADLKARPDYSININENNTVSIVGTISPGITREFKKYLALNPAIEQIILNSTGGNIFEARGIAKLIMENNLNTHVSDSCLSSCTTAFIAGHSRSIGEYAKLGFHQYKLDSIKLFAPNVNANKELRKDIAYFLSQGVSQNFLDRAFATPYDDMWYPSHGVLIEAGIIN